jgi:hypothetical protein
MKRIGCVAALLLAACGCVHRRAVITSDPPNAAVYKDGVFVGRTPVDIPFIYYGKYRIALVLDGHKTLIDDLELSAPWYEVPPLDFFSENVWPCNVFDVRRKHYLLQPRCPESAGEVAERGVQLRDRGRQIGRPREAPPFVQPGPQDAVPLPPPRPEPDPLRGPG